MEIPIISIIIPCFNHGRFIDDAIHSVEQSTRNDYEIIIINDGSTDEYTNRHLHKLKRKGYNIILQENQGLGKTRNNGIGIAKGKYILPLDADNMITPEYITKAVGIMEADPSISIVYSDRELFGNTTGIVQVGEFDVMRIIKANYIDACAIYRKKVWETNHGYDEKMPAQGWEDWDFWLTAIENGFCFYYIPEPLFLYRVLDNSMIQKLVNNPKYPNLIKYFDIKHSIFIREKYILEISRLQEKAILLQKGINSLKRSKSYRLGKFILKPFSLIKRQLNKY